MEEPYTVTKDVCMPEDSEENIVRQRTSEKGVGGRLEVAL
jgi:hypothetical protein